MQRDPVDSHWKSADGLTLAYRDYPGGLGAELKAPVVCLHGLTRNGRDFAGLAAHIAQTHGRRVIVPDMRGRGDSDYAADSDSYAIPIYVADVRALLAELQIDRAIFIGTSMGGLMTMMLASQQQDMVAGALLNDIGPVVEVEGLAKIRSYVGQGRSFPTWMHAARALAETQGEAHPGFAIDDWLAMAKRNMTLVSNGRIAFDYDMKIAEPILASDAQAVPPDLWPVFDLLGGVPLLFVRGALSTLFSLATLAEMQRRMPQAQSLTVPDTGHAPTLDEPEVRAAIDGWLATCP